MKYVKYALSVLLTRGRELIVSRFQLVGLDVVCKTWIFEFGSCSSPVIFNGTQLLPPATAINYVPWACVFFAMACCRASDLFHFDAHRIVGFIFQHLIRRSVKVCLLLSLGADIRV